MTFFSDQAIKGYLLHEQLGSGGLGAVYRATQADVNREVAIKVILPSHANKPDFIRRFEVEAQIIAQMEHPYIVPLYDYWRDPQGAFLIMRLMRGGSLRGLLRQHHSCNVQYTARLLGQVASALHHVHQQRVIHRDIKPSNILLDESGVAYLADFGIAKRLVHAEGMTEAEAIFGSLDYISPEQARGEPVSPSTDVYSLGIVLYEMLTGEHPLHDTPSTERLYKQIHDPLPEITTLDPAMNGAVNAVIQRATAKDPQQRYSDVLSLAQGFSEVVEMTVAPARSLFDTLTEREVDILRLISDGLTNQAIAQHLVVEHSTVRWYIRQINRKLGVLSRKALKRKIAEYGWFADEDSTEQAGVSKTVVLWDEIENPYKGLRAFERGEAQDFFGREDSVEQILARMQETHPYERFLAIVGPSGSGKSSIAKAGMIPALGNNAIPGSQDWFLLDMMPGDAPLEALEMVLTRIAAEQASNLYEFLNRNERGLIRAAELILPDETSELLLLIDQFEEVFTLVEEEAMRQRFLDLIVTTVTAPHSRVRIVITMRADFYDRPLQYPEFGEILRQRMVTLLPLSAKELERAIVGPIEKKGLAFEDGLVAQIISDSIQQAGTLPLLQFALTALFNARDETRLTFAAYQQLGGVGGALAHRAEELFISMDADVQEVIRQLFLRLVTLGEGVEDTRRRVAWREFASIIDDDELVKDVVELFAHERFLTLDHDPTSRSPVVEVAHEALLRQWERYRNWINANRADLQMQRKLFALAMEWEKNNHHTDYLLRGTRLQQFEEWAQTTELVLHPSENQLLEASIRARAERQAVEQAQQEREKMLERRARQFLRSLVVVLFFMLLGSVGVTLFALDREEQAQKERDRARELALVNGARVALVDNQLDTALALAFAANQSANPSPAAQTILSQVAYMSGTLWREEVFAGFTIDVSPDGKTALFGDTSDSSVVLWDIEAGERIYTMVGHDAPVRTLGFNPDGTMAYSISEDRTIILWDLQTGEMLRRFGEGMLLSEHFLAAAFTPDGRMLLSNNGGLPRAVEGHEANLILWDVETGEPLRIFRGHTTLVGRLAISPDGTKALTCGAYEEIILWDIETGEIIRQRDELSPEFNYLATDMVFLPDGQRALIFFLDTTAMLIDLNTLEPLQTYGEANPVSWAFFEFAVTRDYKTLYLPNHAQNDYALWDIETGDRLTSLPSLAEGTVGAEFLPDGESLLVNSQSLGLREIAVSMGAALQHIKFDPWQPIGYKISPDEQTVLINVGTEETCQYVVYDIASNTELRRFGMDEAPLNEIGCMERYDFAFLPDGLSVLSSASEGAGILWNVETGEVQMRIPDFPVSPEPGTNWTRIVIHPDGQSAFTASLDGTEMIQWDLTTGAVRQRFKPPYEARPFFWVDLSPDGKSAIAVLDQGVTCWDLATAEITCELLPPSGVLLVGYYHPSGEQIVTISVGDTSGSTVTVWDIATEEPLLTFTPPTLVIGGLAFTPDGRYAVMGQPDVSLWDLTTGEEVRRYPLASTSITFAAFPYVLSDGRSFFVQTGVEAGSRYLYRLRIDTHEELVEWTEANRYIRELTCAERETYGVEPLCEADR